MDSLRESAIPVRAGARSNGALVHDAMRPVTFLIEPIEEE